MAKVVITIEDMAFSRGVKVVAEPNFETMMQAHLSGHELTAAHGYALAALNKIRDVSKKMKHEIVAPIPKIQ